MTHPRPTSLHGLYPSLCFWALAVASAPALANARALAAQRDPRPAAQDLRAGLAPAGDVDQDGVMDLAVASRDGARDGRVWILSGANGALLRTLETGFGSEVVELVPAGDVDGDATPDLLVGARGGSFARALLSPASGHVLLDLDGWTTGGSFTAADGRLGILPARDLDGDGLADVSWRLDEFEAGRILAGIQLGRERAEPLAFSFARVDPIQRGTPGQGLTWLEDVDRDGRPEVAYSFLDTSFVRDERDQVVVVLLSGANGHPIWRFLDVDQGAAQGTRLVDLGDVNANGTHDILIAIAGHRVIVLEGATGVAVSQLMAPRERGVAFANSVDALGDVDGDGAPDWAGASRASVDAASAECFVVSSRTGARLFTLAESEHALFEVAGLSDVNQDGVGDIAIVAREDLAPLAPGHAQDFAARAERAAERAQPGAEPAPRGRLEASVQVLSGRDGRPIWRRLHGSVRALER